VSDLTQRWSKRRDTRGLSYAKEILGTVWGKVYVNPYRGQDIDDVISGLDSRYMISNLRPPNVKVLSLTTIATPHRGSAFADYLFDTLGREPDLHFAA
jgi:hypothetical protein